jgi:hypothetical protein
MLRLRATYADDADLRRAIDTELTRGVVLVKTTPPDAVQFRDPVALEIAAPGGLVTVDGEIVSILPGVGLAVAVPPGCLPDVRALLGDAPPPAAPVPDPAAPDNHPAARLGTAEKIQLALHGTRDDRAAILRDQNRALHAFVLKSPQVTVEEVTGWAKNAQTSADFLKQIADRKDWLSRPAIAQALVRNPRTPPEVALRALDHVPLEALRQMAKGAGVPPHVVQAARKKVIGK